MDYRNRTREGVAGISRNRTNPVSESGPVTPHPDSLYWAQQDVRDYYVAIAKPLILRLFGQSVSLEGFYHAYSLVSSRAFLVDAYHGLAMVPIADA